MKWNKIKAYLFQSRVFNFSYRIGGILSGLNAYGLIFNGSIIIEKNFYFSIFNIFYGFFILLPLSYFQMQMSERMGEK